MPRWDGAKAPQHAMSTYQPHFYVNLSLQPHHYNEIASLLEGNIEFA